MDTESQLKKANKDLSEAYIYKTKTKTQNMQTGMMATGGVVGTFTAPIVGTLVGMGIGGGVG